MTTNNKSSGQIDNRILMAGGVAAFAVVLVFVGWYWSRQPASPATIAGAKAEQTQPQGQDVFQPVPMAQHITTPTFNWGDVPFGPTICQDVPFDCQGAIRLSGLRAAKEGKKYPGAVLGVPVGRHGECIHLLHAAENWVGTTKGEPYGKVLFHYANGETRPFYLCFLVHGMDWFGGPRTPEEKVSDPNTRLGWSFSKPDGSYRRFFHTVIANPLPNVDIVSVDFIAPLAGANLWMFGITISDDPSLLAATVPDPNAPPRKLVSLRLTTPEGQPATNAAVTWQAVVKNGMVKFPPFAADQQGVVVLDLPPTGVTNIDFMAAAPDGNGYVGYLDKKITGDFPESLEVKLVPNGATGLPNSTR